MIQQDGVWRPDDGAFFLQFHLGELKRDIPFFLKQLDGRNCVLQAGGALGLYPLALADHFQHVVTFEPDPDNWECLLENIKARDALGRVKAYNGGLADKCGVGDMDRPEPWNIGANRVVVGAGPIPIYTIDHVMQRAPIGKDVGKIDAIFLDIEGMELAALKGAERTILKHSPLIVTEENGNGAKYGVDQFGISDYLETLGYSVECGIGRDRYYRRANG